MEKVIQFLFNPNHDMPNLWVMAVLAILCLVSSYAMRYFQSRRQNNETAAIPESAAIRKPKSGKKKKTGKKKK